MQLNHSLQLAYCTNIHRGETWPETFSSLQNYALAVRERVYPGKPFAIGLRLSEPSAVSLTDPDTLLEFKRWLGRNNCYVFTINGFPYGLFHGGNIKERVYRPDWTSPERVAYTNMLFNLLVELSPSGLAGSVSTLPGTFKEFHPSLGSIKAIRQNLWQCVEHIARLSEKTGRDLHLGLEPEPLCLLESSAETIHLFDQLRAEHPRDERLARHLGVNYDACHFAVEFEEPLNALGCLVNYGIRISKIHVSSALKVAPTPDARRELRKFADDIYLHQVVERAPDGRRLIYRDLPDALAAADAQAEAGESPLPEWRIHFHVPLHAPPAAPLENTNDHLCGVFDVLRDAPELCQHLEMETYTWEVLPPDLRAHNVVEQLVGEYQWTLNQLAERNLAPQAGNFGARP
ncbi:MAG TPA: metabolite traffic protein EboE [Verrucomicrobiae bacterium]